MQRNKRLEARFGWIEASLRYAGRFDKTSYGAHFDIGPPQISADQGAFVSTMNQELARRARQADEADPAPHLKIRRGKIEIARPLGDPPVHDIPDMRSWLSHTVTIPFVRVPDYLRVDPAPSVLKAVCEAILRCQAIRLRIAGETGPEWRNVSGHAIVEARSRLHLRCFDHDCDRFDDIPLTRVMETTCPERGIRYVSADGDHAWRETEDILVELNPNAGMSRARLAVRDYQLRGETMSRRIAVPRALSGLLVEELHGANLGSGHDVPPVLVKRPD